MWTEIPKPSAQSYTNVNTLGKQVYDEPLISYDDASTFYDSYDPNQWTDVAKPQIGQPTWNDLQIQWQNDLNTWDGSGISWIKVSKPI